SRLLRRLRACPSVVLDGSTPKIQRQYPGTQYQLPDARAIPSGPVDAPKAPRSGPWNVITWNITP
ncbi:MAG: hypothetical protein ACO3NR_08770, partial [Rhodothermales bacterium]